MYRRISVPLDGTPESRHALGMAVSLAQTANSTIELVHVAFPPVYGTELYGVAVLLDNDIEELRNTSQKKLDAIAAELEALGVHATTVVLKGDIPTALADHLTSGGTDLVVMTTHDQGRLEHLFLGSVAESLVRHVHIPVLLVRPKEGEAVLTSAPAIRHILVTMDGSPFAEQVVEHATTLATVTGAAITLVSVLEPILATAAMAAGIGGPPSAALAPAITAVGASTEAEARLALESGVLEPAAQHIRSRHVKVQAIVLVDANPARAIVECAAERGVDVIAMSTHGRGAFKRLFVGSVSAEVLRTTPTAVLLYRPV
jgi:nucleotide-binding universal stress UspA family protein